MVPARQAYSHRLRLANDSRQRASCRPRARSTANSMVDTPAAWIADRKIDGVGPGDVDSWQLPPLLRWWLSLHDLSVQSRGYWRYGDTKTRDCHQVRWLFVRALAMSSGLERADPETAACRSIITNGPSRTRFGLATVGEASSRTGSARASSHRAKQPTPEQRPEAGCRKTGQPDAQPQNSPRHDDERERLAIKPCGSLGCEPG